MSYNLVDPTTGDLTKVAGNSNIVDTAIEIDSTWSSNKIANEIAEVETELNANLGELENITRLTDFDEAIPELGKNKIYYVNKTLGTYKCAQWRVESMYYDVSGLKQYRGVQKATSINGADNIMLMREYYLDDNNVIRWGAWQQLVTNDDIFRVGDRRNTIGWADLSNDVDVDGSSNYANNVGRIEGHNALIEISNPSIGYQWPVTNSGANNVFVDFGGTIQYFVDKVNNHLYVRFADSVDMSAWGEIATMDKVNALHKQTVGYIEGSLLSSAIESANLYYQKFGDNKLVINGWISLGSAVPTQGTKIFTLPNGWKTNSNYLLPCYTPNSNSAYACMIDISTSDIKSYTPLPSGVELRFCADIYLA